MFNVLTTGHSSVEQLSVGKGLRRRAAGVAVLVVTLAASACGVISPAPPPGLAPSSQAAAGCITDFNPNTDYFGVKQKIEYAKNFTISYHKSYQVITVKQPTVGGKPEQYVLVKCGAPKPKLTGDLATAQQVTTPVHSLFSASTTHLPSLVALGKLDVLTGVASKALISEPEARQRADSAAVTQFAPAGTADAEKIVAAHPDVLITGGTDDPAYATVRKAGIPVLADAEFLETSPLGQAEWIKYFAALTGTEAKATDVFDQIAQQYQSVAAKAASASKTAVLLSQPYQGVWSMPTGGGVTGAMVSAAGGTWPWKSDHSPVAVSTNLESVFAKSGKAKVWITSTNWTTKKEALASEPRFADFTAYKSGTIWAPSKQVNSAGGNNMFELGILRPDLILGDMVAILHPNLEPNHTFTFYQKLK